MCVLRDVNPGAVVTADVAESQEKVHKVGKHETSREEGANEEWDLRNDRYCEVELSAIEIREPR